MGIAGADSLYDANFIKYDDIFNKTPVNSNNGDNDGSTKINPNNPTFPNSIMNQLNNSYF